MNLFLVTSAISTNYGKTSMYDRLKETIDTCISIRHYAPNSKIILVEGGKPLPKEIKDQLFIFDEVFDFSSHNIMQKAQSDSQLKVDNVGHSVKSVCEAYLLKEALKLIKDPYDRIFKLSGRYRLTERFNIQDHMHKDKFIFLTKAETQKTELINDKGSSMATKSSIDFSPWRYETTFYSFDNPMKAQMIFDYIFNAIVEVYSEGSYIDIETATYLTINKDDVIEVPVIGLTGTLGMYDGRIDK
jgi:hypothetical protein